MYVQHKIPEHAAQVWDYVQRGGCLYLCGCVSHLTALLSLPVRVADTASTLLSRLARSSSTQMPKAVKKAVLAVFRDQGALDEAGAEKVWDAMEREGRLVEETWG